MFDIGHLDENRFPFQAKQPLFVQLKQQLLSKIQSGEWTFGHMLPNELALAAEFGVSQGTVRRAIRDLVSDGVLIRRRGQGTFVSSYSANFDMFYKRFVPIMADDPDKRWKTSTKMTLFEEIPISRDIARLMKIEDLSETIIHIKRLHYAHLDESRLNKVDVFGELFLRKRFFGRLTEALFHGQKTSLYAFYQSALGVTIMHSRDIIKAVFLTPEQARLAGVAYPHPALAMQRQAYDINKNIVELRYQVCLTDSCHLECWN